MNIRGGKRSYFTLSPPHTTLPSAKTHYYLKSTTYFAFILPSILSLVSPPPHPLISMSSAASASVSGPESERWAPQMPNSDLFTLVSIKDRVETITPIAQQGLRPLLRRVMAVRTSPLAVYPPVTPTTLLQSAQAAAASAPAPAATQATNPSTSETKEPPRTGASIGRGHPSTSSRRNQPSSSASVSSSSASSSSAAPPSRSSSPQPEPRTRIHSSTIKQRTERFPGRELHSIAEDASEQQSSNSRPVLGQRKSSYAAILASRTMSGNTTSPSTSSIIDETPFSPRQNTSRRTPGNAAVATPGTASPPRHAALGTPPAGPMHVLPMDSWRGDEGSQHTDEGLDDEEGWRCAMDIGSRRQKAGEEQVFAMGAHRESRLLKLRFYAGLRVRVAGKRLAAAVRRAFIL
ncbi:hypothetical protein C8R43DRAFT_1111063 [Mycena crocata]|nr:hypothetical protein C8R43DRAFT_1111063 [Mycena crocata]